MAAAAVCSPESLRRSRKRERACGLLHEGDAEEAASAAPQVIDLTDSPAQKKGKNEERDVDSESKWKNLNGVKRIMAEFQAMQANLEKENGKLPCGAAVLQDLSIHEDQAHCWRVTVKDFDSDCDAGRNLNKDLKKLEQQRPGSGKVEFEIRFPKDYPRNPFFLRVVRPRMKMYTGHITAGGSVCIQALATGASNGNWQSSYSVEGILTLVTANMLDPEQIEVVTATGPGGLSGPARVDIHRAHYEYGMHEAEAAFRRMEQHHRVHGW